MTRFLTFCFVIGLGLILPLSVSSAFAQGETGPSATALRFAGVLAGACPDAWESPACLRALGESNFVFLSGYGAALQQAGHGDDAETLKQSCAASTASREQEVPAYAVGSAMNECAGVISELVQKNGMPPDLSHFQLLVVPALCLSGHPACSSMAEQLRAYSANVP